MKVPYKLNHGAYSEKCVCCITTNELGAYLECILSSVDCTLKLIVIVFQYTINVH